MNPETQNTEAVLARVTGRAQRLAEINAELLAALKTVYGETIRHGWDDYHNEPVMRLDGIGLETARAMHAAIAKAEGTDR